MTGEFKTPFEIVADPMCVSSPFDEMATKIQKAQAGRDTSTGAMCMSAGERFSDQALIAKLTNLNSVTFNCDSGAAVCKNNGPIDVSSGDAIVAVRDARIKAFISCAKPDDNSSKYDCEITLVNF